MYYVLTVEIRETLGDLDVLVDIVAEYAYATEEGAMDEASSVLREARVIHADKLQGDQYISLALMTYDEYDNIQWVDELEEINEED